MRETIKLAKEAGISGIALMGEPYYYPRFGFERGVNYGLTDEHGNTYDSLMVLPLNNDFSEIKGKLIESKDFEDHIRLISNLPSFQIVVRNHLVIL